MTTDNDASERFIWKEGDVQITRAHPEEDGQETHVHEDMDPDHDGRTHTHEAGKPVTHKTIAQLLREATGGD